MLSKCVGQEEINISGVCCSMQQQKRKIQKLIINQGDDCGTMAMEIKNATSFAALSTASIASRRCEQCPLEVDTSRNVWQCQQC